MLFFQLVCTVKLGHNRKIHKIQHPNQNNWLFINDSKLQNTQSGDYFCNANAVFQPVNNYPEVDKITENDYYYTCWAIDYINIYNFVVLIINYHSSLVLHTFLE